MDEPTPRPWRRFDLSILTNQIHPKNTQRADDMRLASSMICAFFVLQSGNPRASAQVAEFTNKAAWSSSAGVYTTIGFAEFPNNTLITNQYSGLGVLFTDGLDYSHYGPSIYPNDSWGIRGAVDSITIELAGPISWVGVEFPGSVAFELYLDDQLVYASNHFLSSGPGHFAGLVSSSVFDEVRIFSPLGAMHVDDLHFGPPIPAPSAFVTGALLSLAGFHRRRRDARSNTQW